MPEGDSDSGDVIQVVEESILPLLERSGWEKEYEVDEDALTKSRRVLAEEYWEAGNAFMDICFGILFVVLLVDHVVLIEPTIYGLLVNIAGAAAIFFSGVRDPAMIAAIVDSDDVEAKRELEARKMAYHNSGFVLLFVGFFLQLLALVLFPDSQIIEWSILKDGAPTLQRGGLLFILGFIFYQRILS